MNGEASTISERKHEARAASSHTAARARTVTSGDDNSTTGSSVIAPIVPERDDLDLRGDRGERRQHQRRHECDQQRRRRSGVRGHTVSAIAAAGSAASASDASATGAAI